MRKPNWNDITIGQYQAVYQIKHTEYDDILDRQTDLLTAVTGYSRFQLLNVQRADFMKMLRLYDFVNDPSTIKTKFPLWLQIKGKLFKTCNKIEKISGGQYLDLIGFCKGGEEQIHKNLHNIIATICLPLRMESKYNEASKKREWLFFYKGEEHSKLASFLQSNMTMAQAWPIALFFWKVWQELMPDILENLQNELREMKILLSQDSMKNTAGS